MLKINIAIADNQAMFTDSLVYLLENQQDFKVTQTALSGKKLLETIKNSPQKPDVLLIDLNMPDMDNLKTSAALLNLLPLAKIIYLSVYDEMPYIEKAISYNASGFMSKKSDGKSLIKAIRDVVTYGVHHNEFINISTVRQILSAEEKDDFRVVLTEKEKLFVRLLCNEMKMSEIAGQMEITLNTAKTYRKRIMVKIGAKKTVGIINFAIKNKIYLN